MLARLGPPFPQRLSRNLQGLPWPPLQVMERDGSSTFSSTVDPDVTETVRFQPLSRAIPPRKDLIHPIFG
jgi:hypothetical protein